jgi:LAO/AO transport system kinase
VAVLAIDPSSVFSRGAVLGDRIRMQDLVHDAGAFVRSMASHGAVGGVARASAAAIDVLDAAGFDRVLIETVGVGQSELDIAALVHTVVLVEAPGLGDEVQAIKAGVLEIADIVVLNKGDLQLADVALRTLTLALSLAQPAQKDAWQPRLLRTDAVGKRGIEGLRAALDAHRTHAREGKHWAEQQAVRAKATLASELREQLYTSFMEELPPAQLAELVAEIAARTRDPYSTARHLLAARS